MPSYYMPLKERKAIADETMAFWLSTEGTGFAFKPGQFVSIALENPPYTDEKGSKRTFTIASSPNTKGSIMIATRMRDSAFKKSIREAPLGTKVKVQGPMGSFTLHEDASRAAVFLAGGIGITPFRSIIEWATQEKLQQQITLFYSNKTPSAAAFIQELEDWAKQNRNFSFIPTITEAEAKESRGWKYETGRIDEAMIRRRVKDLSAPIYYIAGPPQMVTALLALLQGMGISEQNIRHEEFEGY